MKTPKQIISTISCNGMREMEEERIIQAMEEYAVQRLEVAETLNTYGKDTDKDLLIDFLGWMNKISATDPMMLETSHIDIAEMFLQFKKI